jgi:ADP-ribose pyrophosphatase YjhB (NUDIX family)
MVNYTEEDLLDHDGIAAIIKNSKGEILMQDHVKYGFWTIPVGKVKHNQEVLEGLKQELQEECGIEVKECKEIAKKDYNYIRDNKKVKVISHLFEVLKFEGEIENKEPGKHREQKFISLEDIKRLPYLSDLTLFYLGTLGIIRKKRI